MLFRLVFKEHVEKVCLSPLLFEGSWNFFSSFQDLVRDFLFCFEEMVGIWRLEQKRISSGAALVPKLQWKLSHFRPHTTGNFNREPAQKIYC